MRRLLWLLPAIVFGGLSAGSACADEGPAGPGRAADQRRDDGGGPPPGAAESGRRPRAPADDAFDDRGPEMQGPPGRDQRRPPPPPRRDDNQRPGADRPRPPRGDDNEQLGGDRPHPPGENARRPDGLQGPGRPDVDQPPPPRWPRGELEALRESDPEMFTLMKQDMELDRQSRDLVQQYRKASPPQREKIKAQVVEIVNKHFDVRQQRRALELKRLEEELQRLRDSVEHRTKARKELVDKRVSELLGPEDQTGF